jgi:hypothetical protein
MLDALRRPLPFSLLLTGTIGGAVLVALYCLAYTALFGHAETIGDSLGWAVANICPWLVAIETGKRAPNVVAAASSIVLALLASILFGYLLHVSGGSVAFELIRRLPAIGAVAFLVAVLRSGIGRRERPTGDIPLLPRQIDWVQAAGNYVELRANGRTVVHRGSIGATERALAGHGFVRIHRSTLVRRDRIARVRAHDVILTDGTNLKVGKRYRSTIAH